MAIDERVFDALKKTVWLVGDDAPRPIPVKIPMPLIKCAWPGLHMHLDIAASNVIGALLVKIMANPEKAKLLASLTKLRGQMAELIIEGLLNRVMKIT
ncbi:hypothetical protein [uncultured Ruegeria sp.]|uniref:hypothetical protein n=1 Tax=uncultured Ruegeria sp. TaxID=259304 RepID=UPI00260B2F7F|nr:hypothetical protein [uncultured Ruegeria sp.]